MQSRLNPYISFKGDAREAMEFYTSVFGGKLTINTFAESHVPESMGSGDKVMHAMLETDAGFVLMASDTPEGMPHNPGNNVQISLSGDNATELQGYWDKLSAGAAVSMPLDKAPWGDTFGMLTDKFGIGWMVNITAPNT
ncbi:VOC family protein [Candidatus Parcubacteria bacterium]|nr:MAG: VOC family protein [Candidatus Parcubacteria bacterium]